MNWTHYNVCNVLIFPTFLLIFSYRDVVYKFGYAKKAANITSVFDDVSEGGDVVRVCQG